MSTSMISWFLVLVLLGNTAWAAWGAFHTDDSAPKLGVNAVINIVVTLLLANVVTLRWNSVIPLWLWWLTAALLAVYLGGLVYRVLTRGAPGSTVAGRAATT